MAPAAPFAAMMYVIVEPNSEVMFSLPGFDADGDKVRQHGRDTLAVWRHFKGTLSLLLPTAPASLSAHCCTVAAATLVSNQTLYR
jgi:hypothetical protein